MRPQKFFPPGQLPADSAIKHFLPSSGCFFNRPVTKNVFCIVRSYILQSGTENLYLPGHEYKCFLPPGQLPGHLGKSFSSSSGCFFHRPVVFFTARTAIQYFIFSSGKCFSRGNYRCFIIMHWSFTCAPAPGPRFNGKWSSGKQC